LISQGAEADEAKITETLNEQEILIQSICETMVPKLVAEDIPLLHSLMSDVFPSVKYIGNEMQQLRAELKKVCNEDHLVYGEGLDSGAMWIDKVLQVYQISCIHHGLMMVGPSGSGKSTAWRALLKALARMEASEGVCHVIDPKVGHCKFCFSERLKKELIMFKERISKNIRRNSKFICIGVHCILCVKFDLDKN